MCSLTVTSTVWAVLGASARLLDVLVNTTAPFMCEWEYTCPPGHYCSGVSRVRRQDGTAVVALRVHLPQVALRLSPVPRPRPRLLTGVMFSLQECPWLCSCGGPSWCG
jgi:hypothetical protein